MTTTIKTTTAATPHSLWGQHPNGRIQPPTSLYPRCSDTRRKLSQPVSSSSAGREWQACLARARATPRRLEETPSCLGRANCTSCGSPLRCARAWLRLCQAPLPPLPLPIPDARASTFFHCSSPCSRTELLYCILRLQQRGAVRMDDVHENIFHSRSRS